MTKREPGTIKSWAVEIDGQLSDLETGSSKDVLIIFMGIYN